MADNDVIKQLEKLLDPIKKDLGEVKSTLKRHDEKFAKISQTLSAHGKEFNVIEKVLGNHGKKVDDVGIQLDAQGSKIESMEGGMDEMGNRIDEMNNRIDKNTSALINIEDTIKIYGDMYDINNGNIRKLEKRIDVLEDKNETVAPPELRLVNLT